MRVSGGQWLVHRGLLSSVQGMRRELVLKERFCKPGLCHSFFLRRRREPGGLVARAARRDKGLEGQTKRPSHLGKKGPFAPSATATPGPSPALPSEEAFRKAE